MKPYVFYSNRLKSALPALLLFCLWSACSEPDRYPLKIVPHFIDKTLPPLETSSGIRQNEPASCGIILISIDTLRSDPLGCYGCDMSVTPVLDRFAQKSILFQNEIVQLPGTLPSHMSIMTSLYPRQHQVYPPDSILNPGIKTGAEIFKAHGFLCAGFTEGGYVKGRFGFARGFDIYDDTCRSWETVLNRATAYLDGLPDGSRFFLFLHTYQVHDPYHPQKPYKSMFCRQDYTPAVEPLGPNLSGFNAGRISIPAEDVEYFKTLYIAEIRQTDTLFARFFQYLTRKDLMNRVMIVVTSDHGEEFLEHGKLVHEQIYQQLVHVPLIIRVPDWNGRKLVSELVESIDILPALTGFAGLEPDIQFQGRDLLRQAGLEKPLPESQAYTESFVGKSAALLEKTSTAFRKLILKNLEAVNKDHVHFPKEFDLQVEGERPVIRGKAYHRMRRVEIFQRTRSLGRFTFFRRFWRSVELDLQPEESEAGTVIRCVSDGCTIPAEVTDSKDIRCLSMALTPTDTCPLIRAEHYDLEADPAESSDISGKRNQDSWHLHRDRLLGLMDGQQPMAEAGRQELDTELADRLKALGYLDQ